jgi:hypothetical protein
MSIFNLVLLTVAYFIVIGIVQRKRWNGNLANAIWWQDMRSRASPGDASVPSQSTTLVTSYEFLDAIPAYATFLPRWPKNDTDRDVTKSRTASIVLNEICDADLVGKLDRETNQPLREQMSVEAVEQLYQKREMRRSRLRRDCPRAFHAIAWQSKPCLRSLESEKRILPLHRFGTQRSED